MPMDRKFVEETLKRYIDTENERPNLTVEEMMARIDTLNDPSFEAWVNGVPEPDREAGKQIERLLYSKATDYHRDISMQVIDPPYVVCTWVARGTIDGEKGEAFGCSIFEVSDEGKMIRAWMYLDMNQSLFTLLIPKQ